MRRFFLFPCAIVALLVLVTTAAFAGSGKGRSDAAHGKSTEATHGKAKGSQSIAHSTLKASTHGKTSTHVKTSASARAEGKSAPGCNGTIHLSAGATAGNGTQPKYTMGEEVWAHGRGFDGDQVFTHFTVYKVNSGHAVIKQDWSGWTADAAGLFDLDVIDTSLTPGHEYQVVVYWNRTLPNGKEKECRKSKNFFTTREEEQGGGVGGTTTEETGGTTTEETGGTTTEETGGTTTGEVAGTVASGNSSGGGAGGVLGAAATRNLPFTGLPLWMVVLAGATLLASGIVIRRLARDTR
jgi:hypothetical protein